MIRVQHNQSKDIREVNFTDWEYHYTHDFWTIIEFSDMVVWYEMKDGKKSDGRITTRKSAHGLINNRNDVTYVEYPINQYLTDFKHRDGRLTEPFKGHSENVSKTIGYDLNSSQRNTPYILENNVKNLKKPVKPVDFNGMSLISNFFNNAPDFAKMYEDAKNGVNEKETLNVESVKEPQKEMKIKNIDDIIEYFKQSEILLDTETATDEEREAVSVAIDEDIIYRAGNPFYRLTKHGDVIKNSGLTYTKWMEKYYMSNNVKNIADLLHFVDKNNGISTHKMTPPSEQKLIDKAYRKKLIYKENNNFYKLDDLGHDFIDSGLSYDQFIEKIREKSSSNTINTTINGDNNTVPTDVNHGNYFGEVKKVNKQKIDQFKADKDASIKASQRRLAEIGYKIANRSKPFYKSLNFWIITGVLLLMMWGIFNFFPKLIVDLEIPSKPIHTNIIYPLAIVIIGLILDRVFPKKD